MLRLRKPLLLASGSPRRKDLLEQLDMKFTISPSGVPEDIPNSINPAEEATFLAKKKAFSMKNSWGKHIVLAADTIVLINDKTINKPRSKEEAKSILHTLSGRKHQVITGVCIADQQHMSLFEDITSVTFRRLSENEITYYVDNYQPYDKAGAYGAQEWIGLIGIEKMNGSYFNVMGLPVHKVYQELLTHFC